MKNPLPGLPIIESPLFAAQLPHLDLTEEEARIASDLHYKGYAVVDFPDPEFDERVDRIKASLAPHFATGFEDPQVDKAAGQRRIQDAWQFDDDVKAVAANEGMIDLLSKLYGRKAFPFQTLNFSVGTQQAAHSDMVHFSSQPEKFMCGVWLALEDIQAGSGPLFYYPGSHKWPVLSNALVGRRGKGVELESAQHPFEEAWSAICEAGEAEPEVFLAKKGQALIWCANLLHGGSLQTDPCLTRQSQVTHYYFEDCLYYTPAFSDEAMGELELRRVTAIHDGRVRPNIYLGAEIEGIDTPRKGLFRRLQRALTLS